LPQVSTNEFERGTHEILFAEKGVVWTSTISILTRYEGNTVETFTTNGSIISLGEDIKGNLWIGTANYFHCYYEGLVRYDGENRIIYNSSPTGSIPLGFNPIVGDKNGTLWMGGWEGIDNMYTNLVEFDGNNWNVHKPPSCNGPFYIYEIAIDEAGKKWIVINHGLITFDGSNWSMCNDLNSRLQSTNVFADQNGATGNATAEGGERRKNKALY